MCWCVYIVECRTGELYVGVARDLKDRIDKHSKGFACRYTKFRRPVKLLHRELIGVYGDAKKKRASD